MATKRPYVHPSKDPRYKWEVVVPSGWFGKRKRHRTNDRAEADSLLRDYLLRIDGITMTALSRDEQLFIIRWRDKLNLSEMERACNQALSDKGRTQFTLGQVVDKYEVEMRRRLALGTVSHSHVTSFESRLVHVSESRLSTINVSSVKRSDIQEWIDAMTAMPTTKVTRLGALRAVFRYAELEGMLVGPDPTQGVALPVKQRNVSILTPDELENLLDTSMRMAKEWNPAGAVTYWWLVFGAFAGLRTSEIERLDWSDIRPPLPGTDDIGELYVSPGKTTAAERWVRFTPPLMEMDWSAKPSSGPVVGYDSRSTRDRMHQRVYKKAGHGVPSNALRHSYGSHHLVQWREAHQTAAEMGHISPQITFAHYRRAVPMAQAQAYWDLRLGAPFLDTLPLLGVAVGGGADKG